MERMRRDAVETTKITARGMQYTRRRLRHWTLVLILSLAAIAFAFPHLQTAAAIALALLAYNVLTTEWGRYAGPYAGIAARVVRTQMLFIEDSAGRARAWLGVENQFDDEQGARLVFYDEKGRARLALRIAGKAYDHDHDGRACAEVVPGQVLDETYIPPPFPPGKPPMEDAEFRGRAEYAAHVAAVHVEIESKHAREWAETHSGGRRKEQDSELEESDRRYPELVIFDKRGKESVSLASGLTVTGAKGFASVAPEVIFLMSDGEIMWEAPSPARPA
jgi:hypothetical protein